VAVTAKVVWSFSGPLGAAWNEVYFRSVSQLTDALTIPVAAANARLWLLHPSCIWQSISVADVNATRVTSNRRLNWPGQYPGGLAETDYGSPAELSMVCQFAGAAGGSRKLWMRGIPQPLVGTDPASGVSIFGAATRNQFAAFVQSLAAGNYGIRTLKQSTRYAVASVAAGTAPATTVVTYTIPAGGVPLPTVAGQTVILRQADRKQFPAMLGTFTALNVGSNTITIRYQLPTSTPGNSNLGYSRAAGYNDVSVFNPALCAPAYWGSHATRVFTQRSRGARRAARIRTLA
jgi:hypothetical protein